MMSSTPENAAAPCLAELSVLVVDDQDLIAHGLAVQLAHMGFDRNKIMTVNSGQAAIDLVKTKKHFDIMYMDYEMSQTGEVMGDKATVEIRKLQAKLKMEPSIIVTHSDSTCIFLAFPAGKGRCPTADVGVYKALMRDVNVDAYAAKHNVELALQDKDEHLAFLLKTFSPKAEREEKNYSEELKVMLPSEWEKQEDRDRKSIVKPTTERCSPSPKQPTKKSAVNLYHPKSGLDKRAKISNKQKVQISPSPKPTRRRDFPAIQATRQVAKRSSVTWCQLFTVGFAVATGIGMAVATYAMSETPKPNG